MQQISYEQMENQLYEMWDSIHRIDDLQERGVAFEQGKLVERKMRENFRKQEQLKDAAPELLNALKFALTCETLCFETVTIINKAIKKAEE
jgi:hypothetical protein